MTVEIPERLNLAAHFLDAHVDEGRGDRVALRTDEGNTTYAEVQAQANRFGNLLREAGVQAEQRVVIALPDSAEFVAAFFGTLKIGAVVVMVNPDLNDENVAYFLELTRARAAVVHIDAATTFRQAAGIAATPEAEVSSIASVARASDPGMLGELATSAGKPSDGTLVASSDRTRSSARFLRRLLVVGDPDFNEELATSSDALECFPTHRDDAAIWLFSGGTTGKPKAVVQSHNSFVSTTERYAKQTLGYSEDDITLSVPKLFFGYATGSNLLFPFAVGASAVLFPERCTPEVLFSKIARHRPTILINVPTMINKMLAHELVAEQDLSSLRLSTSAGEALPAELHRRWDEAFGVELLDGLGTAEQWHVFITNRPGDVVPGTLGKVVTGFRVKVCDDDGAELPHGEIGWLWVAGNSRAIGYWQRMDRTMEAFRGEWYVSGDMVKRDADGVFTHCGRGDDMLKVSGKWLSSGEVESCLLEHPTVKEVAVVGVEDPSIDGLVKPHAFVVLSDADAADGAEAGPHQPGSQLVEELQEHVRTCLEPYKYPRDITFLDDLPRTHLGKVDRGKLKAGTSI